MLLFAECFSGCIHQLLNGATAATFPKAFEQLLDKNLLAPKFGTGYMIHVGMLLSILLYRFTFTASGIRYNRKRKACLLYTSDVAYS